MQFEHLKDPARRPGQYPSAPTETVVEVVEIEETGAVELTIVLSEGEEIVDEAEAPEVDVEVAAENVLTDVDEFFVEEGELTEASPLTEEGPADPEDLHPAEEEVVEALKEKPAPKPRAPRKSSGSKKK